jgi:hypothetical protein
VTIRSSIKYLENGKVTKRFRAAVDSLLDKRRKLYQRLAKGSTTFVKPVSCDPRPPFAGGRGSKLD